jgi:hypothetical protein
VSGSKILVSPLWVKGGCRRQVDGTSGLPSAPEMPCAPRQLRLVPQTDLVQLRVIPWARMVLRCNALSLNAINAAADLQAVPKRSVPKPTLPMSA